MENKEDSKRSSGVWGIRNKNLKSWASCGALIDAHAYTARAYVGADLFKVRMKLVQIGENL